MIFLSIATRHISHPSPATFILKTMTLGKLGEMPKTFFLTHLQSICSEQVALEKNTFVSNVSLKFTWNVELNCLLQPLLQRGILVGRKHSGLKPVRRCSLHTLCKAIIASPRVPIPGPFCKSQRPHHTYMNQNTPGRRWQRSVPSGSSRN